MGGGRMGTGLLVVALAAAGSAGCASVGSAYAGGDGMAARLEGSMALPAEGALSKQPVLPPKRPFRIAVAGTEQNPRGTFADLESLGLEEALLRRSDLYSDVVGLPGFLDGNPRARTLDGLCFAAERAQADALLIYETRMDAEQRNTPLVVLNIAILPAWIVPSVPWEISLDTRAVLVHPATGTVWTSVRDARRGDGMAPSALSGVHARDAKRELRAAAFEALAAGLAEKLDRLDAAGTR